MKALILAAGKGKRLGCLTTRFPKPLLPVSGVPILARIMDGLNKTGITSYVVVTGHGRKYLELFLKNNYGHSVNITTVYQEIQNGTGAAVTLCKNYFQSEPFLMTYGDILVEPCFYETMLNVYCKDRSFNYMAVNFVKDPSIGCAVYSKNNMVTKLVEKPKPGTSQTSYNNSGIFILHSEIFDALDNITYSARGELEFTSALETLVQRRRIKIVELKGFWSDVGTVQRLRNANNFFKNMANERKNNNG